jgi:murein tripeptide amidase MpaA
MINVDGVIYGNFRCDIAGNDLNRTWKTPLENLQPQIYKIKKELTKMSEN